MCGHIGYVVSDKGKKGVWSDALSSYMRLGLYMDIVRGKDATGLAFRKSMYVQPQVIKKALPAYEFLELAKVDEVFAAKTFPPLWCIGHNRAATRGDKRSENAHPFIEGNIILAHNGTLGYQDTSLVKVKDFNVDSNAIAAAMATNPAKDVLEDIDGAFALAWHDGVDNTVNIARNDERTFYYVVSADGKCAVWASDRNMLVFLLNFHGMQVPKGEVLSLKVGEHIKFDYAGETLGITTQEFAPREKKNTTTGAGNSYYSSYKAPATHAKTTANTNKELDQTSTVNEIIDKLKLPFIGSSITLYPTVYTPYQAIAGSGTLYFKTPMFSAKSKEYTMQVAVYGIKDEDAHLILEDKKAGCSFKGAISSYSIQKRPGNARDVLNITIKYNSVLTFRKKEKEGDDNVPEKKSCCSSHTSSHTNAAKHLFDFDDIGESCCLDEYDDSPSCVYPIAKNKYVDKQEATKFIEHGCSSCYDPITLAELLEGEVWLSDDVGEAYPLCEQCGIQFKGKPTTEF